MDAADARQEIEEYWQRVEEWEQKGYVWPWQKYDPSQPRDEQGRFGSGGGGEEGGSEYRESYLDRIEGTQAEADREVVKCDKAVTKARTALEEAKQRLELFDAVHREVKAKLARRCEDMLGEVSGRIEKLKAEQEASNARMAELKAKLKKRKDGKAKDDLEEQLKQELQVSKRIIDGFRKAAEDLKQIVVLAKGI